jgi:hypothetical protein
MTTVRHSRRMTKNFHRLRSITGSALAWALCACSRTPVNPAPAPAPVPAPVVAPPAAPVTPPTVTAAPTRRIPQPGDSLIPFERPNGTLLRTGTVIYDLASTRGAIVSPLGIRTVTVTESALGGAPAWLIAESRTGTALATTDSLFLTRADLWPTRWVATVGRTQLAASISRDSLYGGMQTYQGRSSFTTALPPGALLTPGMVDRIVELLPLQAGYRAAASLVLLDMASPRAVPADLAVDGEERVTLPNGRQTDCWVVKLRAGSFEERLWVSKDGSRVVRTEQPIPGGRLTATLKSTS